MALVRMTEKKLAASRANARKSKGPTTPAGKEKVSRNACKHHIYAQKFLLPPAWETRIWNAVTPCVATIEDPVERACLTEYLVLKQWSVELFAYETRLLEQSMARHRSFNRGLQAFIRNSSFFHALARRSQTLDQKAERARKAWQRSTRKSSTKGSVLHFIENTAVNPEPKTLILVAAAGSSTPVRCVQHESTLRQLILPPPPLNVVRRQALPPPMSPAGSFASPGSQMIQSLSESS